MIICAIKFEPEVTFKMKITAAIILVFTFIVILAMEAMTVARKLLIKIF